MAEPKERVMVSPAVYKGIMAVRDTGKTNMLDRPRVARMARQMDYREAADWISANKKEYARAIFAGLSTPEEKGEEGEG